MAIKQSNDISRLTFRTIYCVREVIVQNSVTKASLRLGMSQPAVSQHIGRFEKITGTQVLVSDNSGSKVNQSIKELVFSLAGAQDDFSRFVGKNKEGKLRLGMCECLSTALSIRSQLTPLLLDFEVYIAKPIVLSELFEKGELDLFLKPLYYSECNVDLCTDVLVNWVVPFKEKNNGVEKDGELNIMIATQLSPYSFYVARQLNNIARCFNIVARIDDPVRRIKAAEAAGSATFIPGFLKEAIKENFKSQSICEDLEYIRYGLIYNKKRLPYRTALSLFDKLEPVLNLKEV